MSPQQFRENLLATVFGQEEAINKISNLLEAGPTGTGKSLLSQSIVKNLSCFEGFEDLGVVFPSTRKIVIRGSRYVQWNSNLRDIIGEEDNGDCFLDDFCHGGNGFIIIEDFDKTSEQFKSFITSGLIPDRCSNWALFGNCVVILECEDGFRQYQPTLEAVIDLTVNLGSLSGSASEAIARRCCEEIISRIQKTWGCSINVKENIYDYFVQNIYGRPMHGRAIDTQVYKVIAGAWSAYLTKNGDCRSTKDLQLVLHRHRDIDLWERPEDDGIEFSTKEEARAVEEEKEKRSSIPGIGRMRRLGGSSTDVDISSRETHAQQGGPSQMSGRAKKQKRNAASGGRV